MTSTNGAPAVAVRDVGPLAERWTKAGPVVSHMSASRVAELQETSEATVGEPGPMSLFGFAVGTLLVAIPLAGRMPLAATLATIPALLIFAGIGQFIGGLIAYRKGNTFAATAFCSFGANNVVVAVFFMLQALGFIPRVGDAMTLLGINLFCFSFIAFVLFLASFKLNAAFTLVLLALFPGYGLSAVPNVGGSTLVGHIGGWFLIASAGLAFYSGAALVLNSTYEKSILPMFPRVPMATS